MGDKMKKNNGKRYKIQRRGLVMPVMAAKRIKEKKTYKPGEIQIEIAPEQVQRKIFESCTITLGDSIGTRLEVEFPDWKPMFTIGVRTYAYKEKGKNHR